MIEMDRRRWMLTASGGAVGLLGLGACGDDSGSGAGGSGATAGSTSGSGSTSASGGDDLSDVIYEGLATDEALIELLGLEATFDPAESTRWLEPAADAAVPADAVRFAWAVGGAASVERPLLERVVGVLLGVREAHAHGAPVNGRAYFLELSTASAPRLVRVFTTALTYEPDEAVRQRLATAGGPITAVLRNAIFEQNRVASGGGPFVGRPITLSVG